MNSWEVIFQNSKANNADYYGDRLPVQNWDWPQGTWFQKRLRRLRGSSDRYLKTLTEENLQRIQ